MHVTDSTMEANELQGIVKKNKAMRPFLMIWVLKFKNTHIYFFK